MGPAGASHSATTMFHSWFASGTRWQRVTDQLPGPPPGFLVGGPNPQFSIDACCSAAPGSPGYRCYGAPAFALCQRSFTPPSSQPSSKSYLQYNDPWPANSWAISEPSLYYQSYYVRLLAAFTRSRGIRTCQLPARQTARRGAAGGLILIFAITAGS